ncbi:MAG: hypothetical protein R2911_27800 [Caldilineaceae bacterium]
MALLLRERWSARVNGTLLVGVLALLVVGEHWLYPYRIAPIDVPQWHQQLAQEPGEFGLLELPMITVAGTKITCAIKWCIKNRWPRPHFATHARSLCPAAKHVT